MSTQAKNEAYGARADAARSADDNAARLDQMRDRLTSLSDEARSIRSQVPHEFEPDVERIQQQMQRLGERLSDLSRSAIAYHPAAGALADKRRERPRFMSEDDVKVARAAPDEVIMLGAPADARPPEPMNPWDEAAAEALVQLYESGDPYVTRQRSFEAKQVATGRRTAVRATLPSEQYDYARASSNAVTERGQESIAGCGVDASWLDRRLAEITQRIEQSLAEIRPQSSLLSLGRRFDQLEAQINSAFGHVATRADIDELRIAEGQIEDIGIQLSQLRRQMARLDTIDAHLGTLTAQLSDDRIGRLLADSVQMGGSDTGLLDAIDSQLRMIALQLSDERLSGLVSRNANQDVNYEGLATAAAQKIAASLADPNARDAQARDIGEMRGMLENFIQERRHNDEDNASMLETMQQAIIRVFDRIDALELAQQYPAAAQELTPRSLAHSLQEVQADQADFLPMQDEPAEETYIQPFAPHEAAPVSYAAAPEPPAYATAPFDLDAAFSRSRDAEAAAFGEGPPPVRTMDSLRHDFIADAHRAKLKAASKPALPDLADMRAGELSVKTVAGPEKKRRRSIFSLRSQRVAMGVLVLLAAIPAAIFFMPRTPAVDMNAIPAAQTIAPISGENQTAPAAAAPVPAVPPADPQAPAIENAPPQKSKQTESHQPKANGEFEDAAGDSYDRMDTASLPAGIAVQANDATGAQLAQQQQQARMAYLSGKLGDAAARATPVALMGEHALRANDAPAGSEATDSSIDGRLPPATVGPFSLRLAAAQGDAAAQFEVASRLAEGKGIDQDLKGAAQWYQRAAANGLAMAQFRLGTLYERGIGLPSDQTRALTWYQRAAEQGNVKAMHNLAVVAAGRTAPAPDYKLAARWFGAAAERGLTDSQYNLAVLYENGMGAPKDLTQAYKWLLIAAKAGDADAKGRREAVKAKLNPDQLADAEAQASRFRARTIDQAANDARIAGRSRQGTHPASKG